ncbi:hypothetical protein [Leptospira stimsonii]|uniref:hypothetical protein n=1 Tax=Leptospira stimsonii TaxID=2202203 RepID=UPI001F4D989A|nr:hypothetical protein [Leptospira stimsonii]
MSSIKTTTERENLHMNGWIIFSMVFTAAGFLWGVLYFILGFPQAAVIPGGYAVLSLLSLQ